MNLEQPPSKVQAADEQPRQARQKNDRQGHEVSLRHLCAFDTAIPAIAVAHGAGDRGGGVAVDNYVPGVLL